MLRAAAACAITAALTFALTASTGLAGRSTSGAQGVQVAVGGTAFFARDDLICVNEPANGAPRFNEPGVACASAAEPYEGLGMWITPTRLIITSPPNGYVKQNIKR